MTNSVWEEQDFNENLKNYHSKCVEDFGLPEWTYVCCPYCHKKLPSRGIRGIEVKFNTRNHGDVAIEIQCDDCAVTDVVYFRKAVDNMDEFIEMLKGRKEPETAPLLEEDMYNSRYNNVLEKLIIEKEK